MDPRILRWLCLIIPLAACSTQSAQGQLRDAGSGAPAAPQPPSAAATAAAAPAPRPAQPGPIAYSSSLLALPSLTPEQREGLDEIGTNTQQKLDALWPELQARRSEFHALWWSATPDRAALERKRAELDAVHGRMRQIRIDERVAISRLLTPEQNAAWLASGSGIARGWGLGSARGRGRGMGGGRCLSPFAGDAAPGAWGPGGGPGRGGGRGRGRGRGAY